MAMNKDTVVGIVGAVILVGAMVGVFYYEGTQAAGLGLNNYAVRFADKTGSASASGDTDEGSKTDATIEIASANLTKVTFTLSWTDEANTGPDTLRLTVTSPEGKAYEGEGTGPVTVEIPADALQAKPEGAEFTGADEAAALKAAADENKRTAGMGEWKVSVEVVTAGDGTCVPVANVCPPGSDDTGQAWSLAAEFTHYEGEIAPE